MRLNCIVCETEFERNDKTGIKKSPKRRKDCITCSKRCSKIYMRIHNRIKSNLNKNKNAKRN